MLIFSRNTFFMRIIAGRLRGRRLERSKKIKTRPTTDRVREALFALVESRMSLEDARVLDLFSGTGALAFEALSRGAESAILIELDHHAVLASRDNADSLHLSEKCHIFCSDAVAYLQRYSGTPMDLILADPPYDLELMSDLPDLALPHLRPGGLFVVEHDTRIQFSEHAFLNTSRSYGRTHVSIFQSQS
ncbi:MAG: 16S rRNA (guanine(966)-N(2))-methyltransferase RsmD [Bacteroidetes bacterium]|nr:16S rRNA (guanine(966)-N(2))-methyltransferase RsmD [Bacteroidota bacterium]